MSWDEPYWRTDRPLIWKHGVVPDRSFSENNSATTRLCYR